MEENKIENIQNVSVPQTTSATPNVSVTQNIPVTSSISTEQNIPVTDNNLDTKKKLDNKKVIPLIIICIAIVLIIIGTIISLLIMQENKIKEILSGLGIDDYFKYVLTTDYQKNTNLFDINNEEQMFMYYYYNKNTKIYKIDFQDPTFEGNLFYTYAKYDDYMKYHEKVFGEKSKHEMSMFDIDIPKLNSVGNDVYNPGSIPIQCQYAENTDNCYIKLTKDIENKSEVEISDVKMKDNVITGVVSFNSKTENFEFVFEEVNSQKIIKTLKIIDSLDN